MTECLNTEIKEQLPDLVAETLDADTRARVEQHAAACSACADELTILRAVRAAAIPVPYINVSRIVRALPPAPVPVRDELPWYRRASIQMAAAFLLVAGGLIGVRQAGDRVDASAIRAAAVPPAVFTGESAATALSADAVMPVRQTVQRVAAQNAPSADIALAAGLDEMSTQELTSLLKDIDQLAAVPVDEPEEFSPVNAVTDNPGDG